MLSQYPQSAFLRFSAGCRGGGKQQFATQTLRVHLLGIDSMIVRNQNGGFGECAFVLVFGGPGMSKNHSFLLRGSTAGKDYLEEISVRGNICQNHPFGNHPFANPRFPAYVILLFQLC